MQAKDVMELLSNYPYVVQTEEDGGDAAVWTHCLYPSNQVVTVFVSGGMRGFRVHDGGGAIDVLYLHGLEIPNPDHFLMRFCRKMGLRANRGKVHSLTLPPEGLVSGIVMVANASADAARWGVEHMKPARPGRRNLRKELHDLLALRFAEKRVESNKRMTGKSNRQYHFDYVVSLNHHHRLVVDAVHPDANSINSRVVAHMDLARLDDTHVIQRIVYDDEEEWDTANLNLLQMTATLVPYSGFDRSLSKTRSIWSLSC